MKIPTSFLAILSALAFAANASAAIRTWDGSSSGLWTTAANWSGGVAPVNGDSLVFPLGPTRLSTTNSAGGTTNLVAITFTGSNYVVQSSSLSITNGLTNAAPINSVTTFNAPIAPRASQTWEVAGKTILVLNSNVSYGTFTLTLDCAGVVEVNGNFVGGASGDLTKLGAGRLEMNGTANTLDQVRIGDGTLEIAGLFTANSLTISNGATFAGSGTGSVFSCAGEVRPGGTGGSGLGVLTISGASPSVFQPGGRLQTTLHSPTPGAGYDQLKVAAVPNLANGSLSVFRDSGFPLSLGQKFVIVTNTAAGALTTTFTNLPQNARITNSLPPATIFEISYTGGSGNDVELTVVDVAVAPTGIARVWDGDAQPNLNWTNATNWVANTLPSPGDDLVFPASVASTRRSLNNAFTNTPTFNRLAFGLTNGSWSLNGNALKLLGGIVATNPSTAFGSATLSMVLELAAAQTFAATNMGLSLFGELRMNGHTLTLVPGLDTTISLRGSNSGPGSIVMNGDGNMFLGGSGTDAIPVTMNNGTTLVFGQYTSAVPWVLNGGRLELNSPTTPSLLAIGGILAPQPKESASNPNLVQGDLSLGAAATLEAELVVPVDKFGNPVPLLVVAGTVALTNATLAVIAPNISQVGATFVIISNLGPNAVAGTFAGKPEGAIFAATNMQGFVFALRISYTGGDGNDVTLTPEPPPATGVSRVWGGAGADALWPTAANWSGNTPPATGDDVRFPVNAAQRANTNATPLTLNSVTWDGSNYLHAGEFALVNGLRHGASAGTNAIALEGNLGIFAPQTWAVSNSAATLRVFGEINNVPENIPAQAAFGGNAGVIGLGPITKTGAGVLELENLAITVAGGLIADGGVVRLTAVDFVEPSPLFIHQGRVEALLVNVDNVTATNGELVLRFAVSDESLVGGLSSDGAVTLSSNVTFIVDWTNGAPTALDTFTLGLNGARLGLQLPSVVTNGETILLASYGTNELSGTFANLPEGAVTNLAGRDLQIHYAVSLPSSPPNYRTITLTVVAAPPLFTSIERLGPSDVILRGTASAGATVFIEGTQNFVLWTDLGSTLVNGAGNFTFIDSTGLPFRFYQARSQ